MTKRKATKASGPGLFGKATAGKVTPCKACKGFTVPGRKVASVARNAAGRFVKRK